MFVFPLAAAVICAFYGGIVFGFYRQSRAPAHMVWSASLYALALACAVLFIGSAGSWTPFLARTYYLVIAVSIMALLSVGTVYLLAPRAVAHVWLLLVFLSIASSAILLARSGIKINILGDHAEPGWKAIETSEMLLGLTSALNSIGTLVLVAGAVFAYVYKRMVKANIIIAVGAIVLYYGSNLIKELGSYELISVGQALGASIVFAGIFLTRSSEDYQPVNPDDK